MLEIYQMLDKVNTIFNTGKNLISVYNLRSLHSYERYWMVFNTVDGDIYAAFKSISYIRIANSIDHVRGFL